MSSPYQLVVLYGAPGCGKGTQATLLSERLGFINLGMSKLIGAFLSKFDTPNSPEIERVIRVKKKLEAGDLVDFADVQYIMGQEIEEYLKNNDKLVFEGFPRTGEQAKWLSQFLHERNIKTLFIHFLVDLETVLDRIENRFFVPGTDRIFGSYEEAKKYCNSEQEPYQRTLDTDENIIKHRYQVQYTDHVDAILEAMRQTDCVEYIEKDSRDSIEHIFEYLSAHLS